MAVSRSITPAISTTPATPFRHSSSSPSTFSKTPYFFRTISISTTYILPRNSKLSTSVSGIWDAITGGSGSSREALIAIRRGMILFRQGDVAGSVTEFDNAIKLDPRQKAYLWQRGLSLYYLDRFEEGAEQFRIDVAQNPNDTEESIWCFLCEAQQYGAAEARKRFLEVGRDPRPVMREAYNMFKDGGDPEKLVSMFTQGRESEYFYASLYAGLYYESQVCTQSIFPTLFLVLMVDVAKCTGLATDFSSSIRMKRKRRKFTWSIHVNHLMGKGLMIIWLLLPRFIAFVETGNCYRFITL